MLLPIRTAPPRIPTQRRHNPRPVRARRDAYRGYLACLRWDFGFTCAFCLVHEADCLPLGGGRSGFFWIEHFTPQSVDAARAHDYTNLFYSCRLCNRARPVAGVITTAGQLLDPTRSAWGDHFDVQDDRLVPKPGDVDAQYTHDVYQMNDERKVALRRWRWLIMTVADGGLRDATELLRRARVESAKVREYTEKAAELRQHWRMAQELIYRYLVEPLDAPIQCRCGNTTHHTLPGWLREHVDVDDELRRDSGQGRATQQP